VQQVIGRRLDRLSGECNHTLTLASVIGREFDLIALDRAGDLHGEPLLLALEDEGLSDVSAPPTDVFFVCEDGADRALVGAVLAELRRRGMSADMDYAGRSVQGQFTHPLVVRAKLEISSACHAHGKVPSHSVVTEFKDAAAMRAAAGRAANDQRQGNAGTPVHLARHVDNLVKTRSDKVNKLHFGNRTHAHQCRANCRTDNRGLRHWCINYTLSTKFFQKTCTDLKSTAIATNIFTKQEYRFITQHFFTNGLAYRL